SVTMMILVSRRARASESTCEAAARWGGSRSLFRLRRKIVRRRQQLHRSSATFPQDFHSRGNSATMCVVASRVLPAAWLLATLAWPTAAVAQAPLAASATTYRVFLATGEPLPSY